MDRKVKVAVIDSGINTQISNLNKCVIYSTGFGINGEGYIDENNSVPVRSLHGTIIAMIIHNICSDVEFISINILDEHLSTDGRVLAYALSKVFDYEPDIIHMSLGTLKMRYIVPLKKIINEAKKHNTLLVAAADNSGRISYPAYLKGVIGVKADIFESYMNYFYKHGFFYAPMGTKGIECIQNIVDTKNARGTSMAAAYISGHLANIIKNNSKLTFKEAKKALIRNIKEKGEIS